MLSLSAPPRCHPLLRTPPPASCWRPGLSGGRRRSGLSRSPPGVGGHFGPSVEEASEAQAGFGCCASPEAPSGLTRGLSSRRQGPATKPRAPHGRGRSRVHGASPRPDAEGMQTGEPGLMAGFPLQVQAQPPHPENGEILKEETIKSLREGLLGRQRFRSSIGS
uniref:collagen alpha-2(I) chain-like n=1 Tax=Macaca mulatta TaxID=9544 RepID=UPI0010A2A7C2|nr:collagen alpha-2(I) chain-like [Macaca mulatta]